MSRVAWAIILLFVLGIGLYWQVQFKKATQESANIGQSSQPDFTAKQLKSVSFNEQGKVENRVYAERMEHFSAQDITNFTKPVYLLYPEDGLSHWRIQAKTGTLDKAIDRVVLQDNVIIDAIEPNESIQQLTTSYVELDLKTMIMTSDRMIHVNGQNFTTTGKGLYADLNAHTVELLHHVTGNYDPN